MEKRTVIIVFVVLIVAIGLFVLFGTNIISNSPCMKIEDGYCFYKNVPANFKFQDPAVIDEHELYNFSKSPIFQYFVPKNPENISAGFLCIDSNNPPEYIYYFSKICENNSDQCIHVRRATVCGTFYIVQDYDASAYGSTAYGPYEL
jgi:hypothetical protein